MSGTYFDNLGEENYDGYSICISNAEVMSLNEYRAKYSNGEYAAAEISGMNDDEKTSWLLITVCVMRGIPKTEFR